MKKLWRTLAWIAALAVVAVLLSPIFTGGNYGTQEERGRRGGRGNAAQPGGAPIPVLVAAAQTLDVPVYIEGIGTAKALNSVLVRAQVDGQLLKLGFKEGQDVKKGDVLVQLDPRLYQATLDQAVAKKAQDEALLANAKLDLERYVRLSENNAVTKQQADTQRATVAQDEAQVKYDVAAIDSARTSLGYTTITSPIDGRTGLRNVDEGNLIHASDTTGIVTVSQIQPIAVLFNVPQQQLGRINTAVAQGQINVDALDNDGKVPVDRGRLQSVDNTVDQTTGTIRLKAEFPNAKLQLWPGAFVNVRLLVETLKSATVVPVAALQRGPKGQFVYIVQDDKVAVRPVKTGQQDDKEAVIDSGVKAGERVVTTGFAKLTDGARVSAGNDDSAAPDGAAPALHQNTGAAPPHEDGSAPPERRRGRDRRNPRDGASADPGRSDTEAGGAARGSPGG